MPATIDQVYKERNSLAVGFALLALKNGLRAGIDTKQGAKTIIMVEVDPIKKVQVSWMCYGDEAGIARRLLPETNIVWDGTYLGTKNDWVELLHDYVFTDSKAPELPFGDEEEEENGNLFEDEDVEVDEDLDGENR